MIDWIVNAIAAIASAIAEGIAKIATALVSAISSVSSAVASGIFQIWKSTASGISQVGSAIAKGISEVSSAISSGISWIGSAIASGIREVSSAAASGIAWVFQAIASGASSLAQAIASGIAKVSQSIASGVTEVGKAIAAGFLKIGEGISSGIALLLKTGDTILAKLDDWFNTKGSPLTKAAGIILGFPIYILNGLLFIWDDIAEFFSTGSATTWLYTHLDPLHIGDQVTGEIEEAGGTLERLRQLEAQIPTLPEVEESTRATLKDEKLRGADPVNIWVELALSEMKEMDKEAKIAIS